MKVNNNIVFLISKDCMPVEALPCYGGCKYWEGKTPNIDELARKGTIFKRHYTAAPSTSMSMSAMLTGKYPYEFKNRMHYVSVNPSDFPSIFDTFQESGYKCHMIWDKTWINLAWRFVREFGNEEKTIFHNLDIAQATTAHKLGDKILERNDDALKKTKDTIFDTLHGIDYKTKLFVWMHLPHILKGRRSYQDDMDVFDEIVGEVRRLVGDENIILTSDHGHMNMHKHKIGYGFDVYEPAIRIPLIMPRIDGLEQVNSITSNVDLPQIIINHIIPHRDFVISDTKYYAQPQRTLSIIGDRFKYIYHAGDRIEELYDLKWDPLEEFNILEQLFYDVDRKRHIFSIEHYFYPFFKDAMAAYIELKEQKNKIWREGTFRERIIVRLWLFAIKIKNILHF